MLRECGVEVEPVAWTSLRTFAEAVAHMHRGVSDEENNAQHEIDKDIHTQRIGAGEDEGTS